MSAIDTWILFFFVKQCFLKILFNPSLPDMWILKCESYHYFYINTCNHMVHTVVGQQYPHTLSVVDQINTCIPMVHTVVGQQYIHTHCQLLIKILELYQYFDINVNYWYMDIVLFVKQCFLKILFNPSLPEMWILKCESYLYFYINTCNHIYSCTYSQCWATVTHTHCQLLITILEFINILTSMSTIDTWIFFVCKTMFP